MPDLSGLTNGEKDLGRDKIIEPAISRTNNKMPTSRPDIARYTRKFEGLQPHEPHDQLGSIASLFKELGTFTDDPSGTFEAGNRKSFGAFSRSSDNISAPEFLLDQRRKSSIVQLLREESMQLRNNRRVSLVLKTIFRI